MDRLVALVTGASTGIGLATSRRLLADGHFVILTARDSSLQRLAGADLPGGPSRHWLRRLDVRDARERRELMAEIKQHFGRLDVLVNNAGVMRRAPIEHTDEFEGTEQMLVNFHAPLELSKLCLPLLRRAPRGHIIMLSSAAGFFPMPTMGFYSATKHALEGASEALYHELRPWNIHVTLVEPGFVATGFIPPSRPEAGTVGDGYEHQTRAMTALVERAMRITTSTPDQVADAISGLLRSPRPPLRCQVTLDARVFALLKRFLPAPVFEGLIGFCLQRIRDRVGEARRRRTVPSESC